MDNPYFRNETRVIHLTTKSFVFQAALALLYIIQLKSPLAVHLR